MRILALVSQKGGVGKTTLAGHLAVEAERGGSTVAMLDTDPQGSLAAWWNSREAEAPLFVGGSLAELRQQLTELEAMGVDLVVIDTPPRHHGAYSACGRMLRSDPYSRAAISA